MITSQIYDQSTLDFCVARIFSKNGDDSNGTHRLKLCLLSCTLHAVISLTTMMIYFIIIIIIEIITIKNSAARASNKKYNKTINYNANNK